MSRRRRRSRRIPKPIDPEPTTTTTTTPTVAPTTTTTTTTEAPAPSSDAEILTFSIPGQDGSTDIDDVDSDIYLTMPNGTNLSDLTATFTISPGATSSPVSPVDGNFAFSVGIIVTAEDGTTRTWSVTVEELAE